MPHILVIDDDAALREMITMMLRHFGYEVSRAADGMEGLAVCRRETPDLVLTDMVMPRLDGIGFIQAARQEFPELPIIAMSGGLAESGTYLQVARAAGAYAELPKPFAVGQLTSAIAAALADRTGLRAENAVTSLALIAGA
ncbi:MAG TPA: response regulator [Opitutaceae bacterium]|nr:response regulator [Opitutaceae bacterium]